jgi:hypothetical protein
MEGGYNCDYAGPWVFVSVSPDLPGAADGCSPPTHDVSYSLPPDQSRTGTCQQWTHAGTTYKD